MQSTLARSIIRGLGVLITVASVYYVVKEVIQEEAWETLRELGPQALAVLGVSCILYALSCALLSLGWYFLIGGALPFLRCHRIYGASQIAKYLPGNVFHLAGRHTLGVQAGLDHARLAASAVGEILSLLIAAGSLASAVLLWDGTLIQLWQQQMAAIRAGVLILIGIGIAGLWGMRHLLRNRVAIAGSWVLRSVGVHLLFFICSGALLYLLSQNFTMDGSALGSLNAVGIASASWLIGFVTPGASAGMGVREASIILLATPVLGEEQAILLALGFRLTTLGGDLLYFVLSRTSLSRKAALA